MCLFIETIRIDHGRVCNLSRHNRRLNDTRAHFWPESTPLQLSDYLSCHLNKDYSTLSKLFSEVRGITIERFAILHRIEYAKELLCYSQFATSEIAYRLGYSSPAHLSSQFKQVTGMTPKVFRELENHDRVSLDAL